MPVCMFLVELAITCVHDYMVVTVKVTMIYGKMNFYRWALAITAVPTTLLHDNWLRTSATYVIFIRRELGGIRFLEGSWNHEYFRSLAKQVKSEKSRDPKYS